MVDYKVLHNRYLRFPYDHLMCFKNIERDVDRALRIKLLTKLKLMNNKKN